MNQAVSTGVGMSSGGGEDDGSKRNTDCVYFLASPLTCKKGNECEYRHSEEARMNPRDCWYWLNGNCLNAKCAFRHPPLDVMSVTTAATHTKALLPHPVQTSVPTQVSTIYNPGKQGTPCYYFQQGHCLKGDRCQFMHSPPPFDKPVTEPYDKPVTQPPATKVQAFTEPYVPKHVSEPYEPKPVAEPYAVKKPFGNLERCTQSKPKAMQVNLIRQGVPQSMKKSSAEFEMAPPSNNGLVYGKSVPLVKSGTVFGKTMSPPSALLEGNYRFEEHLRFGETHQRYKPVEVPSIVGGNPSIRNHRTQQSQPQNAHRNFRGGKESNEFVGETSPGFDVLVDDELEDADFYGNGDEVRQNRSRERRQLNDFDHVRTSDYGSSKFGREKFNESHSYADLYVSGEDRNGWEQRRRTSSERTSDRPAVSEKRRYQRSESSDDYDESDLRYRLAKQRKISSSRSTVSPDHRGDRNRRDDRSRLYEDNRYKGPSRREVQPRHISSQESSVSNRLQGRISIPGRSLPDDMDQGRTWGNRLSPVKSSSYQGRIQDRIKHRDEEDYNTEGRHLRRSDEVEKEDATSFEGPKPLSVILKRKREVKATSSGDGEEGGESSKTLVSETRGHLSDDEEGLIRVDDVVAPEEVKAEAPEGTAVHSEEALIEEDQNDYQNDEEYDYENGEDLEGEYYEDEEDEEEFAKRVGVDIEEPENRI